MPHINRIYDKKIDSHLNRHRKSISQNRPFLDQNTQQPGNRRELPQSDK